MTHSGNWLVIGAGGAIGGELLRRLRQESIPAIGTARQPTDSTLLPLDLSQNPATWVIPSGVRVAFVCAAITSGDQCRKYPEDTRCINVEQTLRLALLLQEGGSHVVFLSTNQVFDGTKPSEWATSPTSPRSEYGRQKATVERELLATGATVVRFTKVAPPKMPLISGWVETLRRGETIAPFVDMVMSPIPLAFAVEVLYRVGERLPGTVIQVSGDQDVTYSDIAFRIADRIGASRSLVRPVSYTTRGITPEMAPVHTTLDTTTLNDLQLASPPVWETIDAIIERVLHG